MLPNRSEVVDQFKPIEFRRNDWTLQVKPDQPYPWFLAKEICHILGLKNMAQALNSLDSDERSTVQFVDDGIPHKISLVNEPGLYSLIMRSRKPEARQFRRWITHDILPMLRTTGSYSLDDYYSDILNQINTAKTHLKALEAPAVDFKDILPELNVNYGKKILFALLRHVGVFDTKNKPFPEYVEKGYFKVETEPNKSNNGDFYNWKLSVKVTGKGLKHLKKVVSEWKFAGIQQ